MTHCTIVNWEPKPSVSNITKNKMDHRGEIGRRATASGYATKAKPAPVIEMKQNEINL